MIGSGFIWLLFQELVIDLILLGLNSVDIVHNLLERPIQILLFLFDSEKFLESLSKIACISEIEFIEIPDVRESKKFGYLVEPILSGLF